jgi:hypothetical protein
MYYSKIGVQGAGLTNQLFCLITSIINAYKEGHKVVVVDQFLNDIKKTAYTPISSIFNLNTMNVFLKENYDLVIVDKTTARETRSSENERFSHIFRSSTKENEGRVGGTVDSDPFSGLHSKKENASFELLSVLYGVNASYIDLTDCIIQQYVKNNTLFIPKDCCFNNINGDPSPGLIKNVILKYKVNEHIIEEIYNEYLTSDIVIDFDGPYNYTFGWIDAFNNNMFEKILTNITYTDDFIYKAGLLLNQIPSGKKINIIHLRLEDDGIIHWSRQNNMSQNDYRTYLEQKYIYLIENYLDKNDENIILSHSFSNGVIDYLNSNNYNYRFITKFFNEREKDAIVDFLVSKCCNNIFIGNFNINQATGSTFSYYIGKCMTTSVVKIYIDLDRIYDAEVVIH